MSSPESVILRAVLIGIGATIFLDVCAALLAQLFKMPPMNWSLVGRWIGHMRNGRLVHENIARVDAVPGETAIGWVAHYLIGIAYGLLLVVISGREWLVEPTMLPPLFLSWVMLLAPFFVMMPGMGSGIAGSKTPNPNVARLRSFIGHSIFGAGLFTTAVATAYLWPTSA